MQHTSNDPLGTENQKRILLEIVLEIKKKVKVKVKDENASIKH